MCFFKKFHINHKILTIDDEESLKNENISIEDSMKNYEEHKNKIDELKNKLENEMIIIDKLYDNTDKLITKSYEIKHESLINEENGLKEKLKNEVTKIKEQLELNLAKINEIIRKSEKIIKGVKILVETEDNKFIKKLNYCILLFFPFNKHFVFYKMKKITKKEY